MESGSGSSIARNALATVRKRHSALMLRYQQQRERLERTRGSDAPPRGEAAELASGSAQRSISSMPESADEGFASSAGDDLEPEIEKLMKEVEESGKLLYSSEDRCVAEGILDFWQAALYRTIGSAPEVALDEFHPTLDPNHSPYMRLEAFGEGDAELFFGRARLVEVALRKLRFDHFVALIGQSGSGKSSLLRAGIIPAVNDGRLGDGQRYHPIPVLPGAEPLQSLAHAAVCAGAITVKEVDETVRAMRHADDHLSRLLEAKDPILLAIDQFEEVFTRGGDDAACFVANMLSLLAPKEPKHRVVITMRTEFESRCAAFDGLHPLVIENAVRVGALSAAELREAIERPAELLGVKFEPGLVADLVNEVLGEANGLPLLQFALWKLWEKRQAHDGSFIIPRQAYRDLEGVRLALASTAERFYVAEPARQRWIHLVLLRIVRFGSEWETVNNRISLQKLYEGWNEADRAEIAATVKGLAGEGLLRITDEDDPERAQVELAHEALARSWERLARWIQKSRRAIFVIRDLEDRAQRWLPERDPKFLLNRGALEEWETYSQDGALRALGYDPTVDELVVASRRNLASIEARAREAESRKTTILRMWAAFALACATIGLKYIVDVRSAAIQQGYVSAEFGAEAMGAQNLDEAILLALAPARFASEEHLPAARRLVMRLLGEHPLLARYLYPHGDRIFAVSFRPDPQGKTLVSVDRKGQVIVWDLAQNPPLPHGLPIAGASGLVRVTFSRDGNLLAYGRKGGGLAVFDTSDPLHPKDLSKQLPTRHSIVSVAFVGGGKRLCYIDDHDELVRWDLDTHSELGRKQVGKWVCAAFSPDGVWAAVGKRDRSFVVHNLTDGSEQKLLMGESEMSVEFSPDGHRLAAGSKVGDIRVWAVPPRGETFTPAQRRWHAHEGAVYGLSFRADGTALASASGDGTVGIWSPQTGAPLSALLRGLHEDVNQVAWSPDGRWLASGSDDQEVILWEVNRMRPLLGLTSAAKRVAFVSDDTVIGVDQAGDVAAWMPDKGGRYAPSPAWKRDAEARYPSGGQAAPRRNLSANGKELIEYDSSTNGEVRVRFRDPRSGQLHGEVRCGEDSVVRVSSEGGVLAVYTPGEGGGVLRLEDVRSGKWSPGAMCTGLGDDPTMAISPNGGLIALASEDGGVKLWRWAPGSATAPVEMALPLTPAPDKITCLEFNRDGVLAGGSSDGNIWIWDTGSGKGYDLWNSHRGRITVLAFNQAGDLLASGRRDGVVSLWNLSAKPCLPWPTRAHNWPVSSLSFSPDGRRLVSGADDGEVVLMQVGPTSWSETVDRACATVNRDLTVDEWNDYLVPAPKQQLCPRCSNCP